MSDVVQSAFAVGLLYSLATIAVALSFRFANFPDLGFEFAVVVGAIVCFRVLSYGYGFVAATAAAAAAGACVGLITATLHAYGGVSKLLAGVIAGAIMFSLNVRLMGGRANVRFADVITAFDSLRSDAVVSLVTIGIVIIALSWLFTTRIGYDIRLLGDAPAYLLSLGRDPRHITMVALAVSNAVAGIAGAVLTQEKHVCDLNMATGLLISGLASVVLAESVLPISSVRLYLVMLVLGTITYNLFVAAALHSWTAKWDEYIWSTDVRLIAGCLLILPALIFRRSLARRPIFMSDW